MEKESTNSQTNPENIENSGSKINSYIKQVKHANERRSKARNSL